MKLVGSLYQHVIIVKIVIKTLFQCQTMKPEESMLIREHRLIQNTKLKRLKYLP